ncbi:MAG TPA: endolytic transglycosylase MltG, partial [Xylella fastidiosa subsp. multiplex]
MMLVLIVLLGLIARPDLKHYVPGWKYYEHYQHFAHTPLSASASSVEIARGDSLHTVLLKLRKAGVQSGSDLEWQLLAYQVGAAGNLKFGDYALAPAVSPHDLLQRMRHGKGEHYRFT